MVKAVFYVILLLLHIVLLAGCIGWIIRLTTEKMTLHKEKNELIDRLASDTMELGKLNLECMKKDEIINDLKKRIINTYTENEPTIVRINNVYPVKITAGYRAYKDHLDDIEPELREFTIKEQLMDCMKYKLKDHLDYKISPPDIMGWVTIEGRLDVIPKHE